MPNNFPKTYKLHISGVDQVIWPKKFLQKKAPNLYVEIQLEKSVQRTRVVKRNMKPTWDEVFPLSAKKASAVLSLSVKHDVSMPFVRDPCVGRASIELSTLLLMCENNQRTTLDLKAMESDANSTNSGFITVRLTADNDIGAIAISNAREDSERSGLLISVDGADAIQVIDASVASQSTFLMALGSVVSKLATFVELVDKAAKVHPYANFAWQVTSSLYQAIKGQFERDKKLIDLVMTMNEVYSFVDVIRSIPNKLQLLEDIIAKILQQTVECAIFIREYTGYGFAVRVAAQIWSNTGQVIDNLSNNLIALKQSFDSGSTLQAVLVSSRTFEELEKLVKIERLKLLNPVCMDAFSRPECLPETRQDILMLITDWLTTPSEQNILWLHGLAGSGKSTISTTVAEYFRELGRLGAFLFFDRNDSINSKPVGVIRTLAYKLASFDSRITAAICTQIEHNSGVTEASLRVQFTKLILEPLSSLSVLQTQGPVIIIIDAFDECGDPVSRKSLLTLLAQNLIKLPAIFKFLITSRREFDIEAAFSCQSNIMAKELDIMEESNTLDIYSYLRHHMKALQSDRIYQLNSDWPGEEIIQTLAQSSAGLFIWASTAVKFIIEGHHPVQQLKILLHPHPRAAESALDVLYETALHTAGKWDNNEVAADFCAVLGAIVVGRLPLTDIMIDKILGLDGPRSSKFILSRLHCLLRWTLGHAVQTLHKSFVDYLTDTNRCGNCPWFINISIHQGQFAQACFQHMKAGLKFNICRFDTSHVCNDEVPDLPSHIEKFIPAQLSYACLFWADHLQETNFTLEYITILEDFFYQQFLYWLEVLSLTKKVSSASQTLVSALDWIKDHDEQLALFIADAIQFVSTFRAAISHSAPHIYISAVPFAPTESMVAKQFLSKFSRQLSIDIGKTIYWPVNQIVLEGHMDMVESVAFSPDGKHIVSGSDDQTICVWDAKTGELMSGPFKGHENYVMSVAFSPDSKQIVSGSFDDTVRVWDAETGEMVSGPFIGHTDSVRSATFSFDGKHIASGSDDKTIYVWDAETGQITSGPFRGHEDTVTSVVFSPDGRQIASGSHDKVIQVWNVRTCEPLLGPFIGHTDWVSSIDFSPDGKYIVSGSEDETMYVWNAKTGGKVLGPLRGGGSVMSVAFSPDSKKIVSGLGDQTICVWDAETGCILSEPIRGHTGWVMSVAFSPDGTQIVSGAADHTVRIWDAVVNKTTLKPKDGHTGPVYSVSFSPDGKQIASGSLDQTICVWDVQTGKLVSGPFKGHTNKVVSVAFSPDAKHIVSGSFDNTIRVWVAVTGKIVIGPLIGHTDPVRSVVFSPDGQQILSGSEDQTIYVWDAQTGHILLGPFRGHTDWVMSVAFSPDGRQIVSGSEDAVIQVWDVKRNELVTGPSKIHPGGVRSVAFSSDGKYIVSGSGDGSICVWDVKADELMSRPPFKGHINAVTSVAFSPDDRQIISGSEDQKIQMWNVETGEIMGFNFKGHTNWIKSVAFSPSGTHIASGALDQTIRLWDLETSRGNAEASDPNPFTYSVNQFNCTAQEAASTGFYSSSRLVNGWMLGRESELLFWVPPYNRFGLWWPNNSAVMSRQTTKLNFHQFVHGPSWTQCWNAAYE